MRKEIIGDATLYLADNKEVFPLVGQVDACVTDPPYGIGADEALSKNEGKFGWAYYGETTWDRDRPQREIFDAIRACSKHQIIWGANYFTDFLPPSMQWLVWDKGQRDFSLADFELAWTSQNKAARMKTYPRSAALKDGKVHPTQKPVDIMKWCIELLPEPQTIFDPFMGSGTTGVAAIQMGRKFIGVEQNPTYFEHCLRRITEAANAGTGLFAL